MIIVKSALPTRLARHRWYCAHKKKIHIPQVDELLEKLMHLNLAVLTGTINVGTANFIHRNLKDNPNVARKTDTFDCQSDRFRREVLTRTRNSADLDPV
jgi:hypothetical protein